MSIDEVMKHARIATPCTANWDDMVGDEKTRYCGQCHLNVLNAAEMTDEEVLQAITRVTQGQRVCISMYRRADGTFLTKDCPVGLQKLRQRARQAALWIAGGLSLLLSLPSPAQENGAAKANLKKKPLWHSKVQASAPAQKTSAQCNSTIQGVNTVSKNPPRLMGDVAFPTALQPQIELLRARIKVAQSKSAPLGPDVAEDLVTLGRLLESQYEFDEANGFAEFAVSILEKSGKHSRAQEICERQILFFTGRGETERIAQWTTRKKALLKAMAP